MVEVLEYFQSKPYIQGGEVEITSPSQDSREVEIKIKYGLIGEARAVIQIFYKSNKNYIREGEVEVEEGEIIVQPIKIETEGDAMAHIEDIINIIEKIKEKYETRDIYWEGEDWNEFYIMIWHYLPPLKTGYKKEKITFERA